MFNKFGVYQSYILHIHEPRVSGMQQYILNYFDTLTLILSFWYQNLYSLSSSKSGRLLSLAAFKSHWIVPNNLNPKVLMLKKYKFYVLTFHP